MNKLPIITAKTRARQRLVQALYQWQLNNENLHEIHQIEQQFFEEQDMKKVDKAYFKKLLLAIPTTVADLDKHIQSVIDRPLVQLTPVELAILRLGTYELINTDVPFRVVINEGIELAKRFGAEKSHRYINGVLDKLAQAQKQQG